MKHFWKLLALLLAAGLLYGCTTPVWLTARTGPETVEAVPASTSAPAAQITLVGEVHGLEKTYTTELQLWQDAYTTGQRHLFLEMPYFTAQYLNLWMQAEDDEILLTLFESWKDTSQNNAYVLDFYRTLKENCPETVFHGTDVGHQYDTIGAAYLAYLEENGLQEQEEYTLTQEAIEQGRTYYRTRNDVWREYTMAENFIRAYDQLEGTAIMGFYGGAHTDPQGLDQSGSVPCMAAQLYSHYGSGVTEEDITWLEKEIEPLRVDTIEVGGRAYSATYYGRQDMSDYSDQIAALDFWRLEDAYPDFEDCAKTGDNLPFVSYPMLVEEGQVFVVDCLLADGSTTRLYYRSDGGSYEGLPTTEQFLPEG